MTKLLFFTIGFFLTLAESFSQVINPGHIGKLEGGDGATPYLSQAFSTIVSGNFSYTIGNGSDKLEVLDITNPLAPAHKSSFTLLGLPNGMVVKGNYVYVSIFGGAGSGSLQIIDFTDPSLPVLSSTLTDGQSQFSGGGPPVTISLLNPYALDIEGNNLYLSCQTGNLVQIIDISNPKYPFLKGTLSDGEGGALLQSPVSLVVQGSYVYVACLNSNALEIIDVSDPMNPKHKGSLSDGNGAAPFLTGPNSVTVSGNYAYLLASDVNYDGYLEIVDISNPAAPVHAGALEDGGGSAPYLAALGFQGGATAMQVSGNYAYLASPDNSAFEIVDVSNPFLPIHKGSLLDGAGGAHLKMAQSVFLSGNIAYISSTNSDALELVDISNPANPSHYSGVLNGVGGALLSGANGLAVSGNYAYVTGGGSNALQIVDVSKPFSPVAKGSLLDGNGSAPYLTGLVAVSVSGNYAYAVGQSPSTGFSALEVMDVTNVTAPLHKGSLVADGVQSPTFRIPTSLFISGTLAFITYFSSNNLEIVDISNPGNPIYKSSISRNASSGPFMFRPASVFVSGKYAYVAGKSSNSLDIIDISNPATPVYKTSLQDGAGNAPFLQGASSVFVSGNYAYIASHGSNALEIIDISNPLAPVHAGSLKDGGGVAPFLAGALSVYVAGNFAYLVCGSNVMEVVNVTDPQNPVHQASLKDREGGADLNLPVSINVSGNYACVTAEFSNALEIIYLYSPAIANFSPVTGPPGTKVTLTGQNFNTLIEPNFNGTPAQVTGAVSISSAVITVPAGATIGKISLGGNSGISTSTSNFIVTPTATAAGNVQQTSFVAKWSDVAAIGYYLDVSTDNFATFFNGYNNFPVGDVTNFNMIGLNAGSSFQYRVRSFDGVSMSGNSNAIQVTTIPATPTAAAATAVTQISFAANWAPVQGALGYYLDVSTDGGFMKNFVVGYNNLNVPGFSTASQIISGLNPYAVYYYRVRSYDSAGTSPSSNIITVRTPDNISPVISSSSTPNPTTLTTGASQSFNANISDNVSVDSARIYYRRISEQSFKSAILQGPSGTTGGIFSVTSEPSWYDSLGLSLGMEYYFTAVDEAGNKTTSAHSYVQLITTSISLPTLPNGPGQSSYRIVSFPYQLAGGNSVTSVYANVAWSDHTKAGLWWWDPTLGNSAGAYDQYSATSVLQTVEPGKGYWVVTSSPVTPALSNVPSPKYDRSNLYTMTLKPKWNEIGNPYPVDISWNDVVAYNQKINPGAIFSPLTMYDGNSFVTATKLTAFEGGFVKNSGTSDITIQIPFQGETNTGGRLQTVSSDISEDAWNILMSIEQEGFANKLGGFGMHPDATSGADRYDNFNPPRFLEIPELDFTNAEFPGITFSNDMVRSADNYTWQFTPVGNTGKPAQLKWNPVTLGNATKQLFLLDEERVELVDMSNVSQHEFVLNNTSRFRIFYGADIADKMTSGSLLVGTPYPNPLTTNATTTINMALPDANGEYNVSLQLFNGQGSMVGSLSRTLPPGVHQLEFSLAGSSLITGLYVYKLAIASEQLSKVYTGKIVKP